MTNSNGSCPNSSKLPRTGSLCEIGFGAGVLLGLLWARFPDASLCGVDPSTVMLRQAARAIGDAAIDLCCAAAADLPFENDRFDVTLSFNTVQFWPDLNAGLREIRRVTRPGGTAPTCIQRRLVLDDAELAGLASAIGEHIGDVGQQHLAQSELLTAVVRGGAR